MNIVAGISGAGKSKEMYYLANKSVDKNTRVELWTDDIQAEICGGEIEPRYLPRYLLSGSTARLYHFIWGNLYLYYNDNSDLKLFLDLDLEYTVEDLDMLYRIESHADIDITVSIEIDSDKFKRLPPVTPEGKPYTASARAAYYLVKMAWEPEDYSLIDRARAKGIIK